MTELAPESAVIQLTSGETRVVIPGLIDPRASAGQDVSATTPFLRAEDLLYTRVQDMPSLEALLEENRVATAVMYSRLPSSKASWGPMAAAALAASVSAVGLVLFIIALSGSTRPNPTYGFGLFVGGLGLIATTIAAAKHDDRA